MAGKDAGRPEQGRPEADPQPHEADPTEPAGEQDPANEDEIEEATERPAAFDAEPGDEAADADGESAEAGDGAGDLGGESAEDPLAQAQRERAEYLDLAQRAQADFENYRKRAARESAAAGARAKAGLVRELLPVLDNLERALASAGEAEQHLAEGVRLVHAELTGVLQRSGVEPFEPSGEPFDPTVHEALSTRAEDGAESGRVLEVVEKGYRLNGTVLRPARVVVSE